MNHEILWNRTDKIRSFSMGMADVYLSIRKSLDAEYQAKKTYAASLKVVSDNLTKLSAEVKSKPFCMMINDSLQLMKDSLNKKIAMLSEQMKHMGAKVINPLGEVLAENEKVFVALSQADKNLAFMQEYRKELDSKFYKLCLSSQTYDMIFEDEQIKQQLKNFETKSTLANSKLLKGFEKISEDERAYLFQLENYNTHMPKLLTENVEASNEGRDNQRGDQAADEAGRSV